MPSDDSEPERKAVPAVRGGIACGGRWRNLPLFAGSLCGGAAGAFAGREELSPVALSQVLQAGISVCARTGAGEWSEWRAELVDSRAVERIAAGDRIVGSAGSEVENPQGAGRAQFVLKLFV